MSNRLHYKKQIIDYKNELKDKYKSIYNGRK